MVIEVMMMIDFAVVVKMVVVVAPLRKGLDVAVCLTVCATSSSLALTSNQPHRFTPNALDYTDGGDLGASSSSSSK